MLRIEMRPAQDVMVLDLKGKLHVGAPEILITDKVNSLLQQGCRKILLDLGNVTDVDSVGFGALISALSAVTRQDGQIGLVNITKHVQSLLIITGLLTHFRSFDSEKEALAAMTAAWQATDGSARALEDDSLAISTT